MCAKIFFAWKLFRSCFIYNSNVHQWEKLFLASQHKKKENIAKQKKIPWKYSEEKINLKNLFSSKKKFEGEIFNREKLFLLLANDIISDWVEKPQQKAAKMFKNHLAMIGYNESPNKKAKFWQSYIRSLKGKDAE